MKKLNWAFILLVLTTLFACANDEQFLEQEKTPQKTLAQRTAGNNPYNLDNMRLAYQYLIEQGRLNPEMFPGFEVRTTHKYVKLQPITLEEEDQINADTTFIALDYPLDVDLPESYFEDRGELEEGQIPEYYSSLKINQKIAYNGTTELIEEMYVPEEDPYFENADEDYEQGTRQITTRAQLHDELLFTAYFFKGLEHLLNEGDADAAKGTTIDDNKPQKPVLTNVDNTLVLDGDNQQRFNDAIIKPLGIGKKWYPSGNLRYTDTSLPTGNQTRPLPGAQVLLRQGVTMRQAITDPNGNFSTSKLRGKARFIVQWERAKYNIKNKGLWQAEMRGPKQRSSWNHTIQAHHGEDVYHSLIHTACLDYYYGNRFGLTAPKNNIRIAARQTSSGQSSHVAARGMFYAISIKKWGDRHCDIYGTTIHELAHSAHREVTQGGYDNAVMDAYINILNPNPNAKRFLETWATTVELLFIQQRYNVNPNTANTTDILHHNYRQLMQNQSTIAMGYYTSCGFDMIDTRNQNSTNVTRPVDNVSGYTPKQLEQCLPGVTTWSAWKNKIKTVHNNPTEDFLDELFANW